VEGYSIEVFNGLGDTIAVLVITVEPLREDEILCARLVTGWRPPNSANV
jgi:hypothetical protein